MRARLILAGAALTLALSAGSVWAGEEEKQIVGGVLSGLLGVPQQSPDQMYSARERDRLVTMLQGGEYVTSRQGEPIDLVVYGVPLTSADHVYLAKPIRPSAVGDTR